MARKNLIGISSPTINEPAAAPSNVIQAIPANHRPLAGLAPAPRTAVPVGGISKTIGNITQTMERAQDIERKLAEGQAVVDLDPSLIDGSFVSDRLLIEEHALGQLIEQIREHGQQVPILVRPHPQTPGRFQVAYGHRRLSAVRRLGLKVRAVVRVLTDDQLVVSQGQENNARTNLSHMERALFATRLEDRSFTRDVIMAALGVDKAALSKMISLVRAIPLMLIEAIGPAPDVGRRRWMEFADKLAKLDIDDVLGRLKQEDAAGGSSDERFQIAFAFVSSAGKNGGQPSTAAIALPDLPVVIKKSKARATFVFDSKAEPGFDDFVTQRLAALFAEYKQVRGA